MSDEMVDKAARADVEAKPKRVVATREAAEKARAAHWKKALDGAPSCMDDLYKQIDKARDDGDRETIVFVKECESDQATNHLREAALRELHEEGYAVDRALKNGIKVYWG